MNTQSGLTLLEVIIYCGIFSVLLAGVLMSTYPILTYTEQLSEHTVRARELLFLTEKLRTIPALVMTDPSITITEPLPGIPGHRLVIERGGNEVLHIEVDDSLSHCTPPHLCHLLMWSENNDPPLPLNTERVHVDSLLVYYTERDGTMPALLHFTLTLDGIPIDPLIYTLHF